MSKKVSDDSEFDLTPVERDNLGDLLSDIENDILHPHYAPIREKMEFYLVNGYKENELMGEMRLTKNELITLKAKCPEDFWERSQVASKRWVGRKRARLLTEHGGHDLTAVQTLDPEWSPKQAQVEPQIVYNILQYNGDPPEKVAIEAEISEKTDGN